MKITTSVFRNPFRDRLQGPDLHPQHALLERLQPLVNPKLPQGLEQHRLEGDPQAHKFAFPGRGDVGRHDFSLQLVMLKTPAGNRCHQPSPGQGFDGNGNLPESGEFAGADLPPLDLAAMARVSEACRTAQKLRTLAALQIMNAKIRAENLRRHLP